tara:strand:+ start:39 stop:605 length:567 start_codon:yes stop_codon:yes gene_type:complete
MITLKSTDLPNEIDGSPYDDFGFNYLWKLHGLQFHVPAFAGMNIIKNGFAKYCRSGGFSGVESRIIETLKGIEDSFGIDHDESDLWAELLLVTTGTFDETLSSEQFFHSRNKHFRLKGLFADLSHTYRPVGGHSEFFNMQNKKARAKFVNAQRLANRKIGMEIVTKKRDSGQYGCPTPLENPEERGYA